MTCVRFVHKPPVRLALVSLSAVLARLTVPPFDFSALAFLAWTPFILGVRSTDARRAAALGMSHGVLLHVLGFGWLWTVLRTSAHLSWFEATLGTSAFVVLQSLRSVALALLFRRAIQQGLPDIVAFPGCLVVVELLFPSLFPWQTAVFLSAAPAWIQPVEWGGPLLVSAWVGFINAGFAYAIDQWRTSTFRLRPLASPAGAVALLWLIGEVRVQQLAPRLEKAPATRIGVVQGNLAPAHIETQDPVPIYREETLRLLGENEQVDLVIWPETAVFQPVRTSGLYWFLREHVLRDRATKKRIQVPLLLGMNVVDDEMKHEQGPISLTRSNTALLVAPTGAVVSRYDKRNLFPLTESALLPAFVHQWFGLPPGAELSKIRPLLRPGRSQQEPIRVDGRNLLTTICYEEIFPRDIQALSQQIQPELLLTLSSDSWFGATPAAALHLSLARLRAVEHRKYFLRATTTGQTVLVDPTGAIVWSLPPDELASGVVVARWLGGATWYGQWGDSPWQALSAAFLVGLSLPNRALRYLRCLIEKLSKSDDH